MEENDDKIKSLKDVTLELKNFCENGLLSGFSQGKVINPKDIIEYLSYNNSAERDIDNILSSFNFNLIRSLVTAMINDIAKTTNKAGNIVVEEKDKWINDDSAKQMKIDTLRYLMALYHNIIIKKY